MNKENYPIPTHLKSILYPLGDKNSEYIINGELICTCGSLAFRVEYVGEYLKQENRSEDILRVTKVNNNYFLIINAICIGCNKKYFIFDDHFHGYNGLVCTEENIKNIVRPICEVLECPSCKGQGQNITIGIANDGKADFLDTIDDDKRFQPEQWVDAFGWIVISLKCNQCNFLIKDLISYETA